MYKQRFIFFTLIGLLGFLISFPASAFLGEATKTGLMIARIAKTMKALPDDEIIKLSKLSDKVRGTEQIGDKLGKLDLPNEVLEDTFIRIAVYQRTIARTEAEGMYSRLSGVPGFRSTLRKIIGNNDAGTIGHLNELRIADTASVNGFKVLGVGEKFVDGVKKAPTDIDILLEKGHKAFAIEAKNYAATTKIPMDRYRADLDTLILYQKQNAKQVIPIFAFTNKPTDPTYLKLLQIEADKRKVQLIFGDPQALLEQIKVLEQIL